MPGAVPVDVLDRLIKGIYDTDRHDQVEIFRAPIFFGRRQRRRHESPGLIISPDFHFGRRIGLCDPRQKCGGGIFMD